jgi:hypothetical protein
LAGKRIFIGIRSAVRNGLWPKALRVGVRRSPWDLVKRALISRF